MTKITLNEKPEKLAEPNLSFSSPASKAEELTPEQTEDLKLYENENDEDYDEILEIDL